MVTYWRQILRTKQSTLAYLAFVCVLVVEVWLILHSLPTERYVVGGVSPLRLLPIPLAIICTFASAALLWPPLIVILIRESRAAPFYTGAGIGVATLWIATILAGFCFWAVEIATGEHTEWWFVFVPMWFLSLLFAPQTWIALGCACVIGGFAAAWSEAVD